MPPPNKGVSVMKRTLSALLVLSAVAIIALAADPLKYKYQTPIPPGVATPDKVETSIGTLNLKDGYPDAATTQKVYDNLDRSRALQSFLLALPILEQAAMRDALRKFGPDNQTDFILEDLADSRRFSKTPRTSGPSPRAPSLTRCVTR